MDILIKALQLILALVILVTIHEFGHYIFARMFGVKVNRFYLFFNPKFSLLRYNPMKGTLEVVAWNKKDGEPRALLTMHVNKAHEPRPDGKPTWRDTIYGLGWVPLGGYCDIAGMVDETKDAEDAAKESDYGLNSKPAWQRFCVMVAGVLLNFVLAIIIYIGIAVHWGDDVIPFNAMTEGMDFAPELEQAGFRQGDILVTINGDSIRPTDYSTMWELLQPGTRVGVLREGQPQEVTVSDNLLQQIAGKGSNYVPMSMRIPVVVARTMHGEGAQLAGLQPGDRILRVESDTVPTLTEFFPVLDARKGTTVPMLVEAADGNTRIADVAINSNGKIGIQLLSPAEIFEHTKVHYNLLTGIPRGWELGTTQLTTYVKSLKLIFTKEGAQSLGGFGTLGDLFPSSWNWYSFWQITAFLSIILAFMNIIPIPGLDGGHILFIIVEIISGRKVPDKFLEVANTIGIFFLFALLLYANGNDIFRYLIK